MEVLMKIMILMVVFSLVALVFFLACTKKEIDSSVFGPEMEKTFIHAGLRLLKEKIPSREFSLASTTGETLSLSAFKGRPVFLNFWATWCGPCREEMPSMEAIYKLYSERGLEILAVNNMEEPQDVIDFMKTNELSFPALYDRDGKVSSSYGVQALPTSYLIDREGMVIMRLVGTINWNTPAIHKAFEKLLAQ